MSASFLHRLESSSKQAYWGRLSLAVYSWPCRGMTTPSCSPCFNLLLLPVYIDISLRGKATVLLRDASSISLPVYYHLRIGSFLRRSILLRRGQLVLSSCLLPASPILLPSTLRLPYPNWLPAAGPTCPERCEDSLRLRSGCHLLQILCT